MARRIREFSQLVQYGTRFFRNRPPRTGYRFWGRMQIIGRKFGKFGINWEIIWDKFGIYGRIRAKIASAVAGAWEIAAATHEAITGRRRRWRYLSPAGCALLGDARSTVEEIVEVQRVWAQIAMKSHMIVARREDGRVFTYPTLSRENCERFATRERALVELSTRGLN